MSLHKVYSFIFSKHKDYVKDDTKKTDRNRNLRICVLRKKSQVITKSKCIMEINVRVIWSMNCY